VIFPMKLRGNRILIAMARRLRSVAIVLEEIDRLAEIAAGAADVLVAADAIVDAAGAVGGQVAVGGIVDVAGRAGEDTNFFATDFRGFTRIKQGHDGSRGLFAMRYP
jgi:fructose-1,6-bisphosphatase